MLDLLTEEKKMNKHGPVGSSSDSGFSGFGSCGSSSSSDLNTPAESEMDTTESNEDDFMAELTRQMAENMLQEDDEKAAPYSCVSENSESYQYKKNRHHQLQNREYGRRRAGFLRASQAGPGMRVVFLGGVGSRGGSSGTGVFLPNNPPDQRQCRKNPGCSTVLIPERVLQTLKHHFENRDALACSSGSLHKQQIQQPQQPRTMRHPIMNNQEVQLPQEWTY